ncbi:MAG TPA: cupin domain-containing protein [Terriglobales bacterium]|jgi:quercetin dioxygenase-like cupin family protein
MKKKSTPAKKSAPGLQYVKWTQLAVEDLNPLLQRQLVVGKDVMLARILLKKGCLVPLHQHHNEQISFVTQGALKFSIDGKEIVVRGGEVLAIPPHMPHSAEALEDTISMDIFTPPRADWINGTDQYLREEPAKSVSKPRIVGGAR